MVAITDDDAVPHADWLERIEAVFAASPKVGGVGGRDLIPGELGGPGELHERVGVVQWWGRVVGNHHLGCGGPRTVHVLKGVNCAYRTALLRQVGFDRRLKGAGAQVHFELGIGLELIERGWSLVYDPAILVDHFPAPRQDYDKRNSFNARAVSDAVHNETVLLLQHLPAPRRAALMVWSLVCGTRAAPGLVGLALEAAAIRGWRWTAGAPRCAGGSRGSVAGGINAVAVECRWRSVPDAAREPSDIRDEPARVPQDRRRHGLSRSGRLIIRLATGAGPATATGHGLAAVREPAWSFDPTAGATDQMAERRRAGLDLVDTGTLALPSLDDIGSAPLDGWHASAHLWPDAPPVWPLFGMRMFGMTTPEQRIWRNTSPGLDLREELAREAGLASWFTGEIGAGGVLVADGVWSTSGEMACPPGSAPLWERLGFDVVATPPALGLIAVTSGVAVAAEVPPLLAGTVRRLVNAGLGYARFGRSAPGIATELVIKTDIMADLSPALAAVIAEACAEESAVFATEAA